MEPKTSPAELDRILTDDGAFRLYVVRKFDQGEARMQRIEASIEGAGGVRSGVNDWNETKAQITGAKRFIIGTVAVLGAVGAFVLFVFEVASRWKP